MRGRYIFITALAITCGVGVASWRAASQIASRIQAATHLAAMAQLNAEEKAKAAELALGISEAAERFARDELAAERKMREAAEQALDKAVSRTAQAASALAGQDNMTKNVEEGSSDAGITKEELVLALAAQGDTNKAMESKLNALDTILHLLDETVSKQSTARRQMQTELENRRLQVRDLNSQLQQLRVKAEANAQAPAGKRPAAVKAAQVGSNRPRSGKRVALGVAQKQTESPPPLTKKMQASRYRSSSLLHRLLD